MKRVAGEIARERIRQDELHHGLGLAVADARDVGPARAEVHERLIQEPVGALPGLRTPGAERREIDGDGLGPRRGLHQRRPARDVNLRLRDAVALERQLPVALVERHAQPARLPGPDDERRQEDDVGQKHGLALGVGGTGAERRTRELEEAGAGDERFAATNHVLAQEPMTLAAELDVEGDRRVGLREPVVGGGRPARGRRGLRLWRRRRGRSRFGPREPVALAFERVGRQRHAAAAFRSVTALPVDVGTVGPEAADGRLEERQRGFGLAGMRQRLHGPGGAAQLRAHQARQGAAGADLHVHPGSVRRRGSPDRPRTSPCAAGGPPSSADSSPPRR